MENLSLSLTSLSSSPQRSAMQPSSHLLMQKRTIEIDLVSFLVAHLTIILVDFVSVGRHQKGSASYFMESEESVGLLSQHEASPFPAANVQGEKFQSDTSAYGTAADGTKDSVFVYSQSGLSSSEAEESLELHGRNELPEKVIP